jgi:hypothetical protein
MREASRSLLLAESHLTRRLFGGMVRRIDAVPAGRSDKCTGDRPSKRLLGILAYAEGRDGAKAARRVSNITVCLMWRSD